MNGFIFWKDVLARVFANLFAPRVVEGWGQWVPQNAQMAEPVVLRVGGGVVIDNEQF